MVDKKDLTDEQIARHAIFGQGEDPFATPDDPQPADVDDPPVDPKPDDPPADPVEPNPNDPPVDPVPAEPAPVDPEPINYSEIPDDKFLELINSKFNANFENVDTASQFVKGQYEIKNQEEVIQKLISKNKENANVLSHFPNENSYKVAQLAKDYPGKDNVLATVINSDVDKLTDLQVIELSARLNKSANVSNMLAVELRQLGIEEDVSDYDSWDQLDKDVVAVKAGDARNSLKQIQSKVEIPEEGSSVDEYVAGLEQEYAAAKQKEAETIEATKPVVESIVDSLSQIKPVEGDDFEFSIKLEGEDRENMIEDLMNQVLMEGYDLTTEAGRKVLEAAMIQEIYATEAPRIIAARDKYVEQRVWAEAAKKYENAEPLEGATPPVDPTKKELDDNDHANKLLGR